MGFHLRTIYLNNTKRARALWVQMDKEKNQNIVRIIQHRQWVVRWQNSKVIAECQIFSSPKMTVWLCMCTYINICARIQDKMLGFSLLLSLPCFILPTYASLISTLSSLVTDCLLAEQKADEQKPFEQFKHRKIICFCIEKKDYQLVRKINNDSYVL